MQIKTPEDGLLLLPREVLTRLKDASEAELKTLLYAYGWKQAEPKEIAAKTGITPAQAEAAIAFWRGVGVFEQDDGAPRKPVPESTSLFRNYDSQTIASYRDENAAFRACCDLVSEKLGKQLTKNDYSSLLYLCDYVSLPPEVVSGIAEFCVSRRGKRSMQYLMKTALSLYEQQGIDSYEKFEAYMAHLEKLDSDVEFVRRLCGFGDRALSQKEGEFLHRWFDEWALSQELVRLSFDKTVDTLGKVSLSYMNAMLKRWHELGLSTPADVTEKDKKPQNATGDSDIAGYGDSDAFFEAALKAGFDAK